MASFGEVVSGVVPKINFAGLLTSVVYAIIIVIVLVILGAVAWWYVQSKRFNKQFVIFDKVGKSFEPSLRGKARFVFIGSVNDRVFILKKPKMVLASPTIQTGRNTYWFFRRSDGELVNFGIEDLNERSQLLQAEMTNQEIAYQRLALEEFAKQRIKNSNWLMENMGMLAGITTIILVLVFLWLILGKMNTISSTNAETITQSAKLQLANADIVDKLSSLLNKLGINGSSTSVVTPVPIPTTS
jgi:hypothetical protein